MLGDVRSVVQELKEKNLVYPCFCTDDELAAMKKAAEAAELPPVYNGKWARASEEQVQAEKDAGTPFCYRSAALLLEHYLGTALLSTKFIQWYVFAAIRAVEGRTCQLSPPLVELGIAGYVAFSGEEQPIWPDGSLHGIVITVQDNCMPAIQIMSCHGPQRCMWIAMNSCKNLQYRRAFLNYCRFRVPPNKNVVVRDLVRGDVTFNTDTLGDFVVMRSNGLPVHFSSSLMPCTP